MAKKNTFKKAIKDLWTLFWKPEMGILPGQLAFFVILSLVPIITLIGYGASYFDVSIASIIEVLERNFGENIVGMIAPIISGETIDLQLVVVFVVMFYIASNGAASIIVTSNVIYGLPQSSWLKRRIKAIFMTIIIVLLYLFILLVPVFGPRIIEAVDYFNVTSVFTPILTILQGPISWLIIFVFIKVIYMMAPDKPVSLLKTSIGAIFSTVGWVLITLIYTFYVNNFAQYDLFYAGLSNIAILMLWIYLLSFVFVIGMNLNHQKMEIKGDIKAK